MSVLTAPSYLPYTQEMTHRSVKAQLVKFVRNYLIMQRIKRLEKLDVMTQSWGALSEAERERQVRVISATRHAIQKMRKMLTK